MRKTVRKASTLPMLLVLASLCAFSSGCSMVNSMGLQVADTPAPSLTPTPTATLTVTSTPTATLTPTATVTPTPTVEPLRLSLNLHPAQVQQGHTLWIEVRSNRAIVVEGTLDARSLAFATHEEGAWTVVGIPVVADPGEHMLKLIISDSDGTEVTTTAPVMVLQEDWISEVIYVPSDRTYLLEPEVVAQDARRMEEVFEFVTARRYWQGAFIWPHNGPVTSPFGMSRTYNNGRTSYHGGIDLSGDIGAPVVAAAPGRVALAESLLMHGNSVILDHGWGVFSGYYHLSEILVEEGQEVDQGTLIGRVGNTGLSTGAHLHWEIRIGGVPVEPGEWTTLQIPAQ